MKNSAKWLELLTCVLHNVTIYEIKIKKDADMKFKSYLIQQIRKHPAMMSRDVAKMCYQAAMGAEHLLSDTDGRKIF